MTTATRKNKDTIVWRIQYDMKDENGNHISDPPELQMSINPENLEKTYTPLVSETRTMGGFIEEFWGEELLTITGSGYTQMFFSSKEGLTPKYEDTEAYNNFIKLLVVYKNNGKFYYVGTPKNIRSFKANPNRIDAIGSVFMVYNDIQYKGFFENFIFSEAADKPFFFNYSFTFKVLKTYGNFTIKNNEFTKL